MQLIYLVKCGYLRFWRSVMLGKHKPTAICTIMKLILFLTLAFTLQASADVVAQRVSLSVKSQSLKTILKDLRKQSSYSFIYSDRDLRQAKLITLDVQQKEILDVLPILFKDQPLTYTVNGRLISIKPKVLSKIQDDVSSTMIKEVLIRQEPIRGRVTNDKGEPLHGASIYVLDAEGKRTAVQTKTDEDGNFLLPDVAEGVRLEISYLGYTAQRVGSRAQLGTVALKPLLAEVAEVEVVSTGYQSIPRERATGAFESVDMQSYDLVPGTNVLDRLEGLVSGLRVDRNTLAGRGSHCVG